MVILILAKFIFLKTIVLQALWVGESMSRNLKTHN
jgi:hypothetical protein